MKSRFQLDIKCQLYFYYKKVDNNIFI